MTDVISGRVPVDTAVMRLTFDDAVEGASFGRLSREREAGKSARGVLEVIGSGTPAANPGDFLFTSQLDSTLQQLRDRADVVIVDGPPLLVAGDALTLSSKVEALLLVTRMNAFRRGQTRDLERVLLASPAMKLGIVATGYSPAARHPYYGSQNAGDSRGETNLGYRIDSRAASSVTAAGVEPEVAYPEAGAVTRRPRT
jgi:Mrp family chromosome partitioning ATPase